MDQVGKLSITVLCYYACLPETHNNKTTGYSSHTVLTLPCPWPCQLTHPGTAVLRPLAPSSPRPPLPSLPPPPAAQQLLCMPVRELKQAQEGGAGLSVTAISSNTAFTPAFTLCKDTQDYVLSPCNKIKSLGQQNIRMGMPLSQGPFHFSFCSKIQQYQLSFKTQIPISVQCCGPKFDLVYWHSSFQLEG